MSNEVVVIGDDAIEVENRGIQRFLDMILSMIGHVRFDYEAIKNAVARALVAEVKRQAALTSTPVDDFIANLIEALVSELILPSREGVGSVMEGLTEDAWRKMGREERRAWVKMVLAKAGRKAPEESDPIGSAFWTLVFSLGLSIVRILLERWINR